MQVKVKLQLTFADKAPGGESPFGLELEPGATVGQVLERLGIPAAAPKVMVVNGRLSQPGRELAPGDELTIFPPLEGG